MLYLKSELRNFLITSKLLTFGSTVCFQLVGFSLFCISFFQLLGQIYNDFLVLKKTQNHSCLWSLPEELVCFVGIVTAVGVTAGLAV